MYNGNLSIADIDIKTAGQQVKEAILKLKYDKNIRDLSLREISRYLEQFADEINLYSNSLKKYLREKKHYIGSDIFREKLTRYLNCDYNEIVKTEKDQIERNVETIYKNKASYKNDADNAVLEKLKSICLSKELYICAAKVLDVLALNIFYCKNDYKRANEILQSAITIIESRNLYELEFEFLSDLTLLYIFDANYINAQDVVNQANEITNKIKLSTKSMFHFSYRQGILYSDIAQLDLAKKKFEEALEFTEINLDRGKILMNIGIIMQRKMNYVLSLQYFDEALDCFDEDDYLSKSILYNNKASLLIKIKDFIGAEKFCKLALDGIGNNKNHSKYYVFLYTYYEVQYNLGDKQKISKQLMELLSDTDLLHKKYFKDALNMIISLGKSNNDKNILIKLENILYNKINTESDKEFINYLYLKYADVCVFIKSGGEYFEKAI